MLAVIKTGGKQYKVKEGDFISVEKLALDLGARLEISDVLMIENDGDVKVGTPYVENASVSASVVEHQNHKTVLVFRQTGCLVNGRVKIAL